MEALTAELLPEDVYGLWALGIRAARSPEPHMRRMRLWGPGGRPSSSNSPATGSTAAGRAG